MLSCIPEKMLPPDLAGSVRKEQHERWAGMLIESRGSTLLALRGLRAVERQPLLLESRTSVRTLELHSLRWCLAFSATVGQKRLLLFPTGFSALLWTEWGMCSHRFYTGMRLKSWGPSLAELLQQQHLDVGIRGAFIAIQFSY